MCKKHSQFDSLCVFAMKWISIGNANTPTSYEMVAENLVSVGSFN